MPLRVHAAFGAWPVSVQLTKSPTYVDNANTKPLTVPAPSQ